MAKLPTPARPDFSLRVSETGDFGVTHNATVDRRELAESHSPGYRELDDASFALHESITQKQRRGPSVRPHRTPK